MLNRQMYLEAFRRDAETMASVGAENLHARVPSCPEWTVSQLLGHLGGIYVMVDKNIRVGKGRDLVHELEDLELDPQFETWFRHDYSRETEPSGVLGWFRQAGQDLGHTLSATSPDEVTWTWFPGVQTAGFWVRRMTHETAIHRWDVENAVRGRGEPVEPAELAGDGVDEVLTVYQPVRYRPESKLPGSGESFHFHQTDGDGEWVVRFHDTGMEVSREHATCDVAVRGSGSDLMLFLWHRISLDRLDVAGDQKLAGRYFELVSPD